LGLPEGERTAYSEETDRRTALSKTIRVALLGTALATVAGVASPAAQGTDPLAFTVHPSKREAEDADAEARRRQELLSRRLDESEFELRAICRQCSRIIDRTVSPIPFTPLETLNNQAMARPRRPPAGSRLGDGVSETSPSLASDLNLRAKEPP
jgi:hypothetical protein